MFASVDSGFILFMLALALATIIVFLIRIGMRKILHPVRKQKVQVAAIEYQDQNLNAKARKLASNPMGGNRSALQVSHLAHVMVDDMLFTLYAIENENKLLRLKAPAAIGNNMAKVGDIGYITYQDGRILSFEKTGSSVEK